VKVVFDTNVLLAAFATTGLCAALWEICLTAHQIFLSEPILDEVRDHLPKFKVPADRMEEIINFLRLESSLVIPATVPSGACRDPDDLIILGTALAAGADSIVTGDQDLLVLKVYQGIVISSPRHLYGLLAPD
jgi:putative PIN family toxin of toxin-antitoxin system